MQKPTNGDLAANVGTVLREARHRLGQTQRDIAALARTSAATVSRVERGNPHVPLATMRRIARSLGIDFTFRLSPDHAVLRAAHGIQR